MHLIIGSSTDVTADLIVEALGGNVLRLNNDRPHDHDVKIGPDGFVVGDQFGRRVTNRSLQTVILRKMLAPDTTITGEELYSIREYTRALEGLLDWIERYKPESMPMSHRAMSKATKFVCSSVARNHFSVPQWVFTTAPGKTSIRRPVVKNLCGLPIQEAGAEGGGKLLYVQEVNPSELADYWPWYLQEIVESRYDLTVAYMAGECHALRLERAKFEGLDWRKFIGVESNQKWEKVQLTRNLEIRIDAYMSDLGLRYGRLDFLYAAEDFSDLQFLEVNPHGQWAWMDLDKTKGIFDAMMRFLTTPRVV